MLTRRLSYTVVTVLACVLSAYAQWDAPATEFARQIAPIGGPGTASLSVRNSSSLPQDQVAGVRRSIESQLRIAGVQIKNSGAAANEIRITLSENVRGWLWVAEVQQGADVKVTVLSVPRAERVAVAPAKPAVTITKTLIVSRAEPILDVAVLKSGNETQLLVLGESSIELMRSSAAGKWDVAQSFNITHTEAFPRDVRGRIVLASDHLFDAVLPGIACAASATNPVSMACHESDDPWPLGAQKAFFNSARNYFTGVVPGIPNKMPPFYTMAALPRGNSVMLLFTGVDGQVQSWDGTTLRSLAGTRDWGSDIAGVRSACGSGVQIIVSGAGDDTSADTLRAFEIGEREPSLVSSPTSFDGPIMALWPISEANGATAIVHNLQTGQYEAYSVAVACNQ